MEETIEMLFDTIRLILQIGIPILGVSCMIVVMEYSVYRNDISGVAALGQQKGLKRIWLSFSFLVVKTLKYFVYLCVALALLSALAGMVYGVIWLIRWVYFM